MIRPLDDDPRKRKTAQDGETVRVGMFMMDGLDPVQRAVASAKLTLLHKPGYVFRLSDADMKARAEAYATYQRKLTDAWKARPLTAEELMKVSAMPGDPGAAERIAKANAQIAATRAPNNAYKSYDKRISERWKGAAA